MTLNPDQPNFKWHDELKLTVRQMTPQASIHKSDYDNLEPKIWGGGATTRGIR